MHFVRDWEPDITDAGEVIYRPMLGASLRLKDGTLGEYDFIVDSGADISLAPRQLARDLGLPWRQGKPVVLTGISNRKACQISGRIFAIAVLLDGLQDPVTIPMCFASVDAPFLLGREGVFDLLRIEFDKPNRTTIFTLTS